jgi:hypothetical protein
MCRVVGVLAIFTLSSTFSACGSLSPKAACEAETKSKSELKEIVQAEIRKRGGVIAEGVKIRVAIRRDGCNYIYRQSAIPFKPGGTLVVQIDQFGSVLEYIEGL